jgi:hypothetical protein
LAGVEVRDGGTENSPLIDTFCQSKPPTQMSSDNVVYVKYYTNSENPNNGFKATAKIGNSLGWARNEEKKCFQRSSGPVAVFLKKG